MAPLWVPLSGEMLTQDRHNRHICCPISLLSGGNASIAPSKKAILLIAVWQCSFFTLPSIIGAKTCSLMNMSFGIWGTRDGARQYRHDIG